MATFTFEITETLQRQVTIKAKDLEAAQEKVNRQYENEDIVLDADDFVDYDIKSIESEESEA